MKRYLYTIVLAFAISGCSIVEPPRPSHHAWWEKDLRYLESELPAKHVNAFFKVRPEEFRQAVDDLAKELPSLRDHEIIVGMKRIVAMIGDPHTNLGVSFLRFPLRLQWLGNGYYVTAVAPVYSQTLGTRLLKIGDVDVEKAYAAVTAVIPHDNEHWLRKRSADLLVAPEILTALKILPIGGQSHFLFEDHKRSRFLLDLELAKTPARNNDWLYAPDESKVQLPLYLKNPNAYYWLYELKDSQTLYFQYNRCQEMESLPFRKFTEQLFRLVDSSSVQRLIIDLRHNSGGNSGLLWPFIMELKKRPTLNQKEHLFVIIGAGTYSSGVLNAAELKEQTNAILMGEPTGARPNMYGEMRYFSLPISGISVFYSTKYFIRVKGDPPALVPDFLVQLSAIDYFAGRDPVLERVLAYRNK